MNTKTIIAGVIMASSLAPFAAFAQAQTAATGAKPKTDFACVQTALDKREDAIITSVDAYQAAVKAALSARKAGLHDAWGLSTGKQRQAARNTAWAAYRTSIKAAQASMKTSRTAAWNAFGTDAKACKTPVVGESKASDQL